MHTDDADSTLSMAPSSPPIDYDIAATASPGVPPAEVRRSLPSYPSARSLALWAIGFLLAGVLLDFCAIVSDGMQLQTLSRMGYTTISHAAALAIDSRQQALALVWGLCYLATVALFGDWVYRACRRLRTLDARSLKYSPGWAVGYFFIPILNLICPYYVISELWRASDPKDPEGTGWRKQPAPMLLRFWWGFWLLHSIWGWVNVWLSYHVATVDQLARLTVGDIIGKLLALIAASFAIAVIWGVEKRQAQRSNLMGLGQPSVRGLGILALPALGCLALWALAFTGLQYQIDPRASLAGRTRTSHAAKPQYGMEFSPDGGTLQVWLPAQPLERSHTNRDSQATSHYYEVQEGNQFYSVGCTDLLKTTTRRWSEKTILDRITLNMMRRVGGRDLRLRDVPWNGMRLRQTEFSTRRGFKLDARMFVRGQRAYVLFVLFPSAPTFPADIDRFLDSLSLTPSASA